MVVKKEILRKLNNMQNGCMIITFNCKKTYTGTIQLGGSTPSYDLETKVYQNHQTNHITEKLIIQKAKDFIGLINQKPPIYSAIKKGGERLYAKARRGETVNIESRLVFVREFKIIYIEDLKSF